MKKITTLKDLNEVLSSIPDDQLEQLGVGTNDAGDGEICVITNEGNLDVFIKYPQTTAISKWIEKILKAYDKSKEEDGDYTTEGFI